MSTDLETRLRHYGMILDRAHAHNVPVVEIPTRQRRGPRVLAAVAAAVAVAAVIVVPPRLDDASRSSRLDAGTGNGGAPSATASSAPSAPVSPVDGEEEPVWPATTVELLRDFQVEQEALGPSADLLDARSVARGYLLDRLPGPGGDLDPQAALEVGELHRFVDGPEPGRDDRGYVTYLLRRGDRTYEGYVDLRRLGGEGTIWYVTESGTPSIRIEQVNNDGTEVTGTATTFPGQLEIVMTTVGDRSRTSTVTLEVAEEEAVEFHEPFTNTDGITLLFRLFPRLPNGSLGEVPAVIAEMRVESGATYPVSAPTTTTVERP